MAYEFRRLPKNKRVYYWDMLESAVERWRLSVNAAFSDVFTKFNYTRNDMATKPNLEKGFTQISAISQRSR